MKKNKNKLGRNDDCPCGSGDKFKVCCDAKSRSGPLVRKLGGDFTEIQHINLFEINTLIQLLCIDSKKLSSFHENTMDLFSGTKKALEAVRDHTYNLKKDIGVQRNGNTWIVDDFDQDLSYFIKDLFIRGRIVIDDLTGLAQELGFSIGFLFGDEDSRKFDIKLAKLKAEFKDIEQGKLLVKFILEQKKEWLQDFILTRNDIEHGVFKISPIEYPANIKDKLVPQFPTILRKNINDLFTVYRRNIFSFARELLIFLIAEKLSEQKIHDGLVVKVALLHNDGMNMKLYKAVLVDPKTNTIVIPNYSKNCPR
jgi:hypothetical protein